MPCTTETPEGKACTKEAGEAPPSIIQPAADRPSRGQRGCPAVAAVEASAAGRHTASPPGTPPNESRRGGASSEREVVVRKRTRGDGKNQTKARSHLLQQRGQSLNPPCRRFACVASRRARALAASHVTARAPGGGRQVTVRVTGRVGPLRRRATREAHAQITLGARAPRAGRDREQPDASVLSAHSIRPASVTEHVGPS